MKIRLLRFQNLRRFLLPLDAHGDAMLLTAASQNNNNNSTSQQYARFDLPDQHDIYNVGDINN
jgi:hypothetical protein